MMTMTMTMVMLMMMMMMMMRVTTRTIKMQFRGDVEDRLWRLMVPDGDCDERVRMGEFHTGEGEETPGDGDDENRDDDQRGNHDCDCGDGNDGDGDGEHRRDGSCSATLLCEAVWCNVSDLTNETSKRVFARV